jgi:hypothetical protein
MSIRTTVTLDEDVAERVKQESRSRGVSFRETLNELLRAGLIAVEAQPKRRRFYMEPHHGGFIQDWTMTARKRCSNTLRARTTVDHHRCQSAALCFRNGFATSARGCVLVKRAVRRNDTIGLPWITLWAFVRLSTNPRVWPTPMPVAVAFRHVREWLAQPGVVTIHPGPRHAELLERVVNEARRQEHW